MDIKNLGCINPYTGLLTSKKVTNVKNKWTENVSRVMSYFGIDVLNDFADEFMKQRITHLSNYY